MLVCTSLTLVIHALFSSGSLFSSCLTFHLILQSHYTAELENMEPFKGNENKAGKCIAR